MSPGDRPSASPLIDTETPISPSFDDAEHLPYLVERLSHSEETLDVTPQRKGRGGGPAPDYDSVTKISGSDDESDDEYPEVRLLDCPCKI